LYLEQIDASGSEGHVPAHDGHVGHHLEVGPAKKMGMIIIVMRDKKSIR